MTYPGNRNAPADNGSASKSVITTDDASLSDPDPTALVDGVHVVVLHSHTPGGGHRWTRRLYLSLHSAEKSLARARMRGDDAYLVMAQLRATGWTLDGGGAR